MKTLLLKLLVCFVVYSALAWVSGNHRSGSFSLTEAVPDKLSLPSLPENDRYRDFLA